MKIIISPSLLASDFSRLGEEAKRIEAAGADWLHIDVMDGHFVPNITLGAPIVKALRPCTGLVFDVHLMISDPLRYVEDFAQAGADIITFHAECESDIGRTIQKIKSCGCKAGLALKPDTSAAAALPYLDELDMVLVMTVEPGFGGQSFMPKTMPKLKTLREECDKRGIEMDLQVDGGISEKTVELAAHSGANVLVAGSAVFNAPDATQAISALRSAAQAEAD